MAPANAATRITFGLLTALLLATSTTNTNTNNVGLFAGAETDISYTDCGEETVPPADGPLGPGETPAPTVSVRCLPSSLLTTYDDDDSVAPTVAASETPEPTVVVDSAVPADDDDATSPPTEAGAGDREVDAGTPSPMAAEEEEGAEGISATAAPTSEGEAGDTTDGAFGLAPPASGAALATSCGLLLVAGLLAV